MLSLLAACSMLEGCSLVVCGEVLDCDLETPGVAETGWDGSRPRDGGRLDASRDRHIREEDPVLPALDGALADGDGRDAPPEEDGADRDGGDVPGDGGSRPADGSGEGSREDAQEGPDAQSDAQADGGEGPADARGDAGEDGGPRDGGLQDGSDADASAGADADAAVLPDGPVLDARADGGIDPPSCVDRPLCLGISCCDSPLMPSGAVPMGRGTENCGSVGCETEGSGVAGCPHGMECGREELPEHSATVDAFRLDRFEVTVGRFRRFVAQFELWRKAGNPREGTGAHPAIAGTGWQGAWPLAQSAAQLRSRLASCDEASTFSESDTAGRPLDLPINCVNYYEAFAFCIWDGGRLATEAEWEYAAAGGQENRLYPWGAAVPNASRAQFDCQWGPAAAEDVCDISNIAPVGRAPAGRARWLHDDLAGNMQEWVFDGYDGEAWYRGRGRDCRNCANTAAAEERVVRGGGWDADSSSLRVAAREGFAARDRDAWTGIRCARPAY